MRHTHWRARNRVTGATVQAASRAELLEKLHELGIPTDLYVDVNLLSALALRGQPEGHSRVALLARHIEVQHVKAPLPREPTTREIMLYACERKIREWAGKNGVDANRLIEMFAADRVAEVAASEEVMRTPEWMALMRPTMSNMFDIFYN